MGTVLVEAVIVAAIVRHLQGPVVVESAMVAALVRHLQVTLQGCRRCVPTMDRDSSCCKFPRRGWCKKNYCEVQKESLRGACS